jgi:hypothetical protein
MPIEYLMWAPLVCTSVILYITLALGALFSIANSGWVSTSSRRLWAAVVILLPIVGSVLWLAASHRYNTAHRDDGGLAGHPQTEPGTAETGKTAAGGNTGQLPSVQRVRKSEGI